MAKTYGENPKFNGVRTELFGFLLMFFFFSASRLFLMAYHWPQVQQSEESLGMVFTYGLRIDIMTVSLLFTVPTILFFLPGNRGRFFFSVLLKIYFLVVAMGVVFIEIATYPFFAEYQCRPNEMFINYLRYPKEVVPMLLENNPIALVFTTACLALLGFSFSKYSEVLNLPPKAMPIIKRIPLFTLALSLLFIGVRSSLGHRPANMSDIAFSNSHIVNEITKNSLYSLGYTVYSRIKHGVDIRLYGAMEVEEALKRVKRRLGIENPYDQIPFLRREKTHFPSNKPKNLVIILEESLGAQFVASFGGVKGLTPNLDRLADRGLAFQNLYATGTRSVRGMEAIVSGFLPVPGESVVKRNKAQTDFFTVAQLLGPLGYRTSFIYGGNKRFDNMGHWYLGNGFETIIDLKDFEDPIFKGIWGVCDEDLFAKSNQYFTALHKNGESFFSVIFTTSFHTPFEFPSGRLQPAEEASENKMKQAIRYADFALGQFFENARTSPYFRDTIFLVVADHDVKVLGRDLVPLKHFKIPGIIFGEGVVPDAVFDLTSQPDVLATALDYIGVSLTHPVLGRSVFSGRNNLAFMQYYDSYALMTPHQVAIVQPGKKPKTFTYDGDRLIATSSNFQLEKDALAFIHTASYLYENKLHKLVN